MDSQYTSRLPLPTFKPDNLKRRKIADVYTDRFLATGESLAAADLSPQTFRRPRLEPADSASMYDLLLESELENVVATHAPGVSSPQNMLHFRSETPTLPTSPFSLSPMKKRTESLLAAPRKPPRRIPKTPYKVLEAPQIQDDFYLNLVDWSSTNILAVGLSTFVYLWNASTSQATKLCSVGDFDAVTSISWMQRGNHLAIGTANGRVHLWDVNEKKEIGKYSRHKSRVGALAWNGNILTSGSRDHSIQFQDIRESKTFHRQVEGHRQEVCGLEWSHDKLQLASGGNDNRLLVWDLRNTQPIHRFEKHIAAVKALTWSPHQRGVLASGGGTADRHIRTWNTLTGENLDNVDTGSQVCNLAWSRNVNEIVSTHGYSLNQIMVWSYPSMRQVATLTGHSMRVLYLAVSPDGQTVVTGAGDETLRFWNLFPPKETKISNTMSLESQFQVR